MSVIEQLMKPAKLPYDFEEWKQLPFPERVKKVCQAWALQGFGSPPFTILFYTLKIAFYIWIWVIFCSFSEGLGSWESIQEWWFKPEALAKALVWTMMLEVLGMGGASGPLTGRYMPPFGPMVYYLRPGTVKIPLFTWKGIPFLSSDKRTLLDVFLYAAFLISLTLAGIAPEITPSTILPIVILLPLVSLFDRQVFLAARGDVWYPAIFVFLFPIPEAGAALKVLWFGVWFWAAFSKLTPSFTSVIGVMICNSPVLQFPWLKKMLFKKYPDDLRLSRAAIYVAHFGTLVEFSLPILLMVGTFLAWEYTVMFYFLLGMTAFHAFIFINFPMGVPMEWNVIMVYGGWVLFGFSPEFHPLDIQHPLLIAACLLSIVILPLMGNFFPRYISFLLSMRYYAGTWAYSVWLFRKNDQNSDAKMKKLEPNIVKSSADMRHQLYRFYDKATSDGVLTKVIAWRFMHLPARALHDLIPRAVDNIDRYYWSDGEFIAGEVYGWNFGDGHLHHERLLASIQERCHFEDGELRVIMVESPQFHNGRMHWRIHDAQKGLLEEGHTFIKDLSQKMPWPEWD